MATLSGIQDDVRSYTEVSSNVLSNAVINTMINNTEKRIFRTIDLDVSRGHMAANLTADNPYLSMPGSTSTTFISVDWMQIKDSAGNRKFLIQKDLSFLTEYNKNSNTTGVPKYYGNWDNDTVYVAPTPSSGFTVELALNRMPSSLTSAGSSGTTWLSTNGEDVLLYGCLVEAYKFLKGPADMLQMYQQSFQEAMQAFAIEQQGRRRRSEYFDGVLRIPLESAQP
jgi:hypothetical protein